MKVVKNLEALIGQTPVIRLDKCTKNIPKGAWLSKDKEIEASPDLTGELLAKIEYFNPGGSIKDRIAQNIIDEAEKRGDLKPGSTIIESTSGNTGAGIAMIAAIRGYKTIFVMPDKISSEKINSLRAFGSDVHVCPTEVEPEDPQSYYSVARRLAEETPDSFLANQYFNPDNPETHYKTTGPEIWEQLDGKIDYFFAGAGTGGTLSGISRYLKEKNPNVKVIAIDPVGSIYYKKITQGELGEAHSYLVEGVGEDILPGTMDFSLVDDCVWVEDPECFSATRNLAQSEGLFVGGSCGMAVYGAMQYMQYIQEKEGRKDYRALVLVPDNGSRYVSKVFNDAWLDAKDANSNWGEKPLGGKLHFVGKAKIK